MERATSQEFYFSEEREPHRDRTKAILKKYPQIKEFLGKKKSSYLLNYAIFCQRPVGHRLVGKRSAMVRDYTLGFFCWHYY